MSQNYPAILLMEYQSIAVGITAADAMAKRAPLGDLRLGTVQPGRFLILAAGEVGPVDEARSAAIGLAQPLDCVLLPDVHPAVVKALTETDQRSGEALGIVETKTVAGLLQVADAGVKGAEVSIATLRMADGLGGKGYLLFSGVLHEVQAAMEAGVGSLAHPEVVLEQRLIAQLGEDVWRNLEQAPLFHSRINTDSVGSPD